MNTMNRAPKRRSVPSRGKGRNDSAALVAAINRVQAVAEFALDGTILSANGNFLRMLGYTLGEIQGRHHGMFVEPAYRDSPEYEALWAKLARGELETGEYRRVGKGGREVWILGSYSPVCDAKGQVRKIVEVATDVTERSLRAADAAGRIAALGNVQAVVEFALDGTILTANDNFLRMFGYSLEDVRGKHHSILVDPACRESEDYRALWAKLARGEHDVGEYRRLGSGGEEVWILATYNPILDPNGRPCKVVEYATDVTAQRREAHANAAFKGAIDNLLSNVMIADNDCNIIYMNKTVREMMHAAQEDIRKDLPAFDAARLVGTNIDIFHKSPSHQRGLLAGLSKTFTSEMTLGGRRFRIIANPVVDARGARLGSVVEWADRTAEVRTEREVQDVVTSVIDGHFDTRIDLSDKKGFFEALGRGMNDLVETVSDVVAEVQRTVELANDGDLTTQLATEGRTGLFVRIASGINRLTENMAGMVAQVKAASAEVSRGAEEISQGNANLSQRTEEQASSLEETASSMEEMTSTVKQNADNAGQANQLAMAARDQAEKGGAVVSKTVTAMAEINESSKKIVDIIGVIDEIAFQTNLLALNAAVEAARAGEQGRGFAVVASEVRSLAGRSATAAKEIKGLIQDSVKKVDEGSSLVMQSGATLEQIVTAVKKVSDIVAEIAAASQEQSAGIEQVNKAVMQLDEMTQQNAALVEQASAASQSMADQARSLNELMDQYSVAAAVTAAAAEAAVTAPAPAPAPADGTRPRAAPAVERRSGNRPWAGRERNSARAPQAAAAPSATANGTDEAGWQEF